MMSRLEQEYLAESPIKRRYDLAHGRFAENPVAEEFLQDAFERLPAVPVESGGYLNDASNPQNAYPAFWAPFEVVGEGAAQ
jgi:hypothetical protein